MNRLFIGVFLAFASFSASAVPTRGNFGGMHSSFVPSVEEEDVFYVTNGLIAMYDGEWNAGLGLHDPNAVTWTDLTGNGHDLGQTVGDFAWGDNCFIAWVGAVYSSDVGFPVNNGTGERTVELVSSGARTGSWRIHLISMPSTNSGPWGIGHYDWSDGTYACAGYSFSSSNISIHGFPRIAGLVLSKCVRLSGNTCIFTVNCDSSVEGGRMNYSSTHLALGNASHNPTANDEVRIFCCRIYDRVLSDEEVAWNFKIDKMRGFGL